MYWQMNAVIGAIPNEGLISCVWILMLILLSLS